MNDIQVFNNTEFGELEILVEGDGALRFPATKCAKILGHANPERAIREFCKEVTVSVTPTKGGSQQVKYITEGDLYRLIVKSRLEGAVRFEKWVFDEVLPSIRKHGGYIAGQENMTNEQMLASALLLAKSVMDERNARIAELEPKADYTDRVLQSDTLLPITLIAKDYGMSGKAFNELLGELGIQYRLSGTWLLYAAYDDKGYTQTRTHIVNDSGRTVLHTYWTQSGRNFLYDFLAKKRNLRPTAERLLPS